MIWSKAMKYPVLMMGIIMFTLYVTDAKTQSWWEKAKRRFVPSTCDSLVTRMEDKVPKSWKMSCPTVNLLILEYKYESSENLNTVRIKMYKNIANILVQFAKLANPETLEDLKAFRLKMITDKIDIAAQTDGEAMIAFTKLKTQKQIAEHLKLTVKVKEQIK